MGKYFDIYLVGVGGQGILTIADIITLAAVKENIPVNYYPTKGMAQRGGFVKAQLRLGRKPEDFGPSIPVGGADMVVSMEINETFKAIKYAKNGADYVVYGHRWEPTAVMLGKAPYPTLETLSDEIKKTNSEMIYIPEEKIGGFSANIVILGTMFAKTKLDELFVKEDLEDVIANRWPKAAEKNLAAFHAGLEG